MIILLRSLNDTKKYINIFFGREPGGDWSSDNGHVM